MHILRKGRWAPGRRLFQVWHEDGNAARMGTKIDDKSGTRSKLGTRTVDICQAGIVRKKEISKLYKSDTNGRVSDSRNLLF